MNKITDIFFDLDETIWDFKDNVLLALEAVLKQHEIDIELDAFLEAYRPINSKYWMLYRANKIDKTGLHRGRFKDSFTELNMEMPEDQLNVFLENYTLSLVNYNTLFPGAYETLYYLNQQYALHVLTDGFSDLQNKRLEKSKVKKYFKTLTASDEVGSTKPNPQIFEAALSKAKAKKENSIMIGDNLDFDVLGARDFGIKAIHFAPGGETDYKGKHIASLTELKELF